jgi:hypothetical protein
LGGSALQGHEEFLAGGWILRHEQAAIEEELEGGLQVGHGGACTPRLSGKEMPFNCAPQVGGEVVSAAERRTWDSESAARCLAWSRAWTGPAG